MEIGYQMKDKVCRFKGKNTLVIYLLQGEILNILFGIMGKLEVKTNIFILLMCFVMSIITIEITTFISMVMKRYCPYLLGIKHRCINKCN